MSATIHADSRTRAQAFWQEWQAAEARLAAQSPQILVEEGNNLLEQHLDDVVLELEGDADKATLIFSANGIVAGFPHVQALVDTATTKRYAVSAFRQRLPRESVERFGFRMNGLELNAADVRVLPSTADFRIDLVLAFTVPLAEEQREQAQHMAFIMLDHILGEWDFAVKIAAVDFADAVPANTIALTDLPAVVDALWRDELAHSGLYPPPEDECQFEMAQCEESEQQDALIFTRNRSAASVLGRADMGWCIIIDTELDSQEDVDAARELEDAFFQRMAIGQQGVGVLSVVNLSRGVRSVYAYCGDAAWGEAQAQASVAEFGQINSHVRADYDPSWGWYRF